MKPLLFLTNLILLLKLTNLIQVNQSIKDLQLKNAADFDILLKNQQKNLFILLLKNQCSFSDDIISKIPEVYSRLREEMEMDFTLVFYYCTNNGFCKNKFNTRGYPELRYYPKLRSMEKEFIIYKHPKIYNPDELFYFFKNRVEGISSVKTKLMLDHFINDQNQIILSQQKKLLLFCKEDFEQKEILMARFLMRQFIDIFSVMILNCEEKTTLTNRHLKKFFDTREKNKKIMCLLKFENDEINCFDKQIEKKNFGDFLKYYQKFIVSPLNKHTMNLIMAHSKPSMLLFMNSSSKHLLKDFKEVAYNFIADSKVNFVYWIKGESDDDDYSGKYIQNLLGVSNSEFPIIRGIKIDNRHEVLRFKTEEVELSQKVMMKFYEDFVKGNLINYHKSHLNDLNILESYHSIIKPYEKEIFNKDFKIDKSTFILIVGDNDCKNSEFAKNQFEKIVLEFLDKDEEFVSNEINLHFASLLREDLDHHVPNELPILLYFTPQDKGGEKKFSSYFWDKTNFEQMIEMLKKGQSILDHHNFFDLNNLKAQIGGEL